MLLPNSYKKWNISILWHPCRMILFCRKTVEYCASSQRRMKVAMLTSVLSITGCCSSGPTDGIPMRFSQRSDRGCQGLFIDINYGPYLTIYIFKKPGLIYRFIDQYRSHFMTLYLYPLVDLFYINPRRSLFRIKFILHI